MKKTKAAEESVKSANGSQKKENIHAGHRERLSEQIAQRGLKGMPDHLVLEFLLFFVIPRKDTNPLAHALIDRFGSLSGVFDASVEELIKVQGVGMTTARFLKIFPLIDERYALEKLEKRKHSGSELSQDEIGGFLVDYYRSKTDEEVLALFFDNGGGLISAEPICKGTVNAAGTTPRMMAEAAFRHKAASIVIAHNHPSGFAVPSEEDIDLTHHLMDCFLPFDITVRAHYVVAGSSCVDILPYIYEKMNLQKPRYIAVRSPGAAVEPSEEAAKGIEEKPEP